MHFVGPDQLHGFEERLTTDIYPADFGWTPDYRKPGERIDWWYHNLGSVTGAGVAEITNQMEYDDEVAFHADQKLYQLARDVRRRDRRPWCLTVSFTHPHDPYVARRKYWDLYEDCPALEPEVGFIPYDEQDPHSQRLYRCQRLREFRHHARTNPPFAARLFRQHFLRRRQGRRTVRRAASEPRMLDDTIILFCSDHGDMLGERGLWFKMCFFEGSVRVPLMIAARGIAAGLHRRAGVQSRHTARRFATSPASTWRHRALDRRRKPVAGMRGPSAQQPVLMEYAAEGSLRAAWWRSARANRSSSIARSIRRNSLIWNRIRWS